MYKYFQASGTKLSSSTTHYSAARGRVYLYSESDIDRATDRRKEYYKFWNAKAEELCSAPTFSKYSRQELHGIIDSHWRMHATSLCIRDAEHEQELVNSLSHELPRGSKLLLSGKTVSKNLDLLREEHGKIKHLNEELNALRFGELTVQARKSIQMKEKELKKALTDLKLAQDRLRKSVDGLTKSRTIALASAKVKGEKRAADSSNQTTEVELDQSCEDLELADLNVNEESVLAQEVVNEDWL